MSSVAAQTATITAPSDPAATTSASKAPVSMQGAGGLMAFKDTETGALRMGTAAEIAALLPPPRIVPNAVKFALPGGGFRATVDPSLDSFMVTIRRPDGTLDYDCLTPQEAAAKAQVARSAPAVAVPRAPAPVRWEKLDVE
ncbi:MAG: hypothetical protein U1F54_18155 [Burkholderiales bacterium]